MKRVTEVNRMLEEQFIVNKPHQRPHKAPVFDQAFAQAMGEPDYDFPETPQEQEA